MTKDVYKKSHHTKHEYFIGISKGFCVLECRAKIFPRRALGAACGLNPEMVVSALASIIITVITPFLLLMIWLCPCVIVAIFSDYTATIFQSMSLEISEKCCFWHFCASDFLLVWVLYIPCNFRQFFLEILKNLKNTIFGQLNMDRAICRAGGRR